MFKNSPQLLEQRIEFETLITDVSARLIKASASEVDGEIEHSLGLVRNFFQVDRCVLLGVRSNRKLVWVTHGSYGEGFEPVSGDINLADLFPWSYERLVIQGKHINLSSIEELPSDAETERNSRSAMGIRSALTIPLSIAGQVSCIIVLNALQSKRSWPEEYVPRLRLLGEIFVSALERRNKEAELKEHLQEIERLRKKVEIENVFLRDEVKTSQDKGKLSEISEGMLSLMAKVRQVADTGSTILIQGETGTGKELVAQTIHQLSSRRERVMVKVNCAALPAALVESELFGREKGAYTGALSRQKGRFELADGSTLFLDEVAEMPLETQAKLLRVLQEGEFERLGSPHTTKVDIRLIAASNRDLAKEVRQGRFRHDLYYRLNIFPILVPPLRERIEDIPQLVWEFVNEFSELMGKKIRRISSHDMALLKTYSWPGNVRELRNVIERSLIISNGETLELQRAFSLDRQPDIPVTLEEVDRTHIQAILKKTHGKIKGADGAAKLLGLKPSTLYSRMRKLGITSRRS
jgi:formate hydrogenlyase transcriptional activator